MAYDAAHGEVVMFGGSQDGYALADTWVWDGTTWTQRFPANSPPPTFLGAYLAYDAARAQVVLFGYPHNQTWVWDGTNWWQKFPTVTPPARLAHAMAYDAVHQQVVLFGGEEEPAETAALSDTWVWDGVNWTQKTPATSPPARFGHQMAYDSAGGHVVLFGGASDQTHSGYPDSVYISLDDTWAWDGTNWVQEFPAASPPGRVLFGLAYDEARSQVVIVGGGVGWWSSFFDDTWVLGIPFAAQVQPPISSDGSSVFKANRGAVPVKFTLSLGGVPTCSLPPATISLSITSGTSPGPINQNDYAMASDSGSNFRVDSTDCQYVYNLGTKSLGPGTYLVQITIDNQVAGRATFGLN